MRCGQIRLSREWKRNFIDLPFKWAFHEQTTFNGLVYVYRGAAPLQASIVCYMDRGWTCCVERNVSVLRGCCCVKTADSSPDVRCFQLREAINITWNRCFLMATVDETFALLFSRLLCSFSVIVLATVTSINCNLVTFVINAVSCRVLYQRLTVLWLAIQPFNVQLSHFFDWNLFSPLYVTYMKLNLWNWFHVACIVYCALHDLCRTCNYASFLWAIN